VFSVDEMIGLFDIADINQSASSFNPDKLLWVNQQHIIATPAKSIGEQLVPYLRAAGLDLEGGPAPEDVAEGFRERAETLVHMAASARYCYEDFEVIDPKAAKRPQGSKKKPPPGHS
jgi:glutamyl-tRNA synthetase